MKRQFCYNAAFLWRSIRFGGLKPCGNDTGRGRLLWRKPACSKITPAAENWVSVQEGRLRRFGLSRGNTDAGFAEWGFLSENPLSGTLACFIFRFAPPCEKLWLNEAWLTNQSSYFGSVGQRLSGIVFGSYFSFGKTPVLCSQFPTRRQREGARNRDGLDDGFLRHTGKYNGEPGI